jgi:D-lactate dehydrogenase (cytochrome)
VAVPAALEQLSAVFPVDRLSTRVADLAAAAHDESSLPAHPPDAVVWPLSTEEVAAVVRIAAQSGTSLTARGAGSSLEGNPIPVRGGIVLDLSRMSRVLAIRPPDLQADVEPGVVYRDLNRQLAPHGLFFPPSPGGSSDVATIGGMVANNASGIYSVKYGGTRDHVRAATVVTGTGEVVRLGNRCRKDSSGYHLLGLMIGSEGTLGIVTEVTLALAGVPAERRRWAFAFPDDRSAASTIADLLRYGIDLAAAEFLDRNTVAAINRFRHLTLDEDPTLLLESHGSALEMQEAGPAVVSLANENGARELVLGSDLDPWKEVRHYATRSVQALEPESGTVRADLAVPISALPELVDRCMAASARHGRHAFVFGHAGIGILHLLVLARRDTPEWSAAEAIKDDVVHEVVRLGGAVSGEHGMGLGNRGYAAMALGPALELMKQVKAVFDPAGILNPGKIW